MRIAALDPGSGESGLVVFDTDPFRIVRHENALNPKLLQEPPEAEMLVVEWMEARGVKLSDPVTETIMWASVLIWMWGFWNRHKRIARSVIKRALIGVAYGNDKYVRRALIERFGDPGTAKAPGTLFGLSQHQWAALAAGVTWCDQQGIELEGGQRCADSTLS